jgi:Na+-transporting NADH:ubiquinone oxidoreductase subunit NqrE
MESGFDKDVKKYFLKVLYSISWGLIWMVAFITLGIYNGLAFVDGKPILYNILFYVFITAGLVALIYYYYRLWKSGGK